MPETSNRRAADAWAAYRRLREVVDAEVARELEQGCGLSMPDYEVLSAVAQMSAELECVRVSELAARMRWQHSRLSRQLGRMERRELIAREPCERDGRGDDVLLAELGRRVLAEAEPIHLKSVRRNFTDLLTPEQLSALVGIEERVAEYKTAH